MERIQAPQRDEPAQQRLTLAELVDRLGRFEGPPDQFLVALLSVQCQLAGAAGGAILRLGPEGRPEALAAFPPLAPGATAPSWLAQAVEMAGPVMTEGATAVRPIHGPDDLYGQSSGRHLVLVPIHGGAQVRGVSAFLLETRSPSVLAAGRERLELTSSLLSLYEMRLTLSQRQGDLKRLRVAVETLAAVEEQERFAGAAMCVCNETASRWSAERVGLGFLKGRYVHLKGLSHTEKFSRKMKLVQDLEAAMEECLDQDLEVVYPADPESTYVCRAARELSVRHGPTAVVSLPLRRGGKAEAVLMVERPADQPFRLEEVEALRLMCEMCAPPLISLYERDRWLGARAATGLRKGLSKVLGPTHTWVKAAVLALLGAILFLVFAKGDYTAEGKFSLEPIRQQAVQAPYEGYLGAVYVRPGERVVRGQVLAELKTSEILASLHKSQGEMAVHRGRAEAAREQRKSYEMQEAEAQAKSISHEIELLNWRLEQAKICSPMDGTVLTGDLEKLIDRKVDPGQVLFEVGPLEELRAEVLVPEDQIAEVQDNWRGKLATSQYPGRKIHFQVERVFPVAEEVEHKNVFRVRIRLEQEDVRAFEGRLRPGMEGLAKIELGRRPYAWLWTRALVNWVRMKLWI